MTFTVTALMTDIDLAESATPWSSASLDAAFFKQGNNSAAFYNAKNARGSETVTPAASVAWSTYTYPHLYFWTSSSVAALMENKSTGTTTASGLTVRVTLSNGAFREWHVAGADTWDGSWTDAFVIDMSHTGTQLYASSGTFSSASNIASVTWYYDLSNSGNIRNVPANTWLDAIRVGEGLQVHNTSAADASFGFAEIAAVDENVSNQYGVLRRQQQGGKALGCAGKLVIGDSAGSNHVDFDSQGETVEFLERDGTGYGLVNTNLYELNFEGNATGTDQDVSLGVKVGTGDTASGRNGSQIRAGGSTVSYSVDLSNANLHNVGWYGSTIEGADRGVGATGIPVTSFELSGSTFDNCDQVDTRDAVVRNCNFLNTVAISTSGALLWDEGEVDAKYCLFVNNLVAVEVPSLTADMAFVGMEFQGNTNDVRYEGATDWDLNWSEASGAPSVQNAGAGTLTPTATVDYTLTNIANPSEVTILDRDVALEDHESTSGINVAFGLNGATGANIAVAQTFQVTTAGKCDRVRVWLAKVGSPGGYLEIRLQSGTPSSPTLLATATIDAADLTTSIAEYEIQFDELNQLSTSTTYNIRIYPLGNDTLNGSNHFLTQRSGGVYSSGQAYLFSFPSTWAGQAYDFRFVALEAASENELYHVENLTTGTTTYQHGGTVKEVEVLVAALIYKQVVLVDTLSTSNKSVPILQIPDNVYSN